MGHSPIGNAPFSRALLEDSITYLKCAGEWPLTHRGCVFPWCGKQKQILHMSYTMCSVSPAFFSIDITRIDGTKGVLADT